MHSDCSRRPEFSPLLRRSVAVGIAYLLLACQVVHKSRSVPCSCPAGAWPLLRMTRRCMAPAKDDTHKSERIWLKHEPYEGRSEVRCQKHLVGLWGGFACLRVFVVPCYPASIRFSMEKYDPLDDLPMQFRRHPASPTPTHYSVVTNNPSPEPNSRNQQQGRSIRRALSRSRRQCFATCQDRGEHLQYTDRSLACFRLLINRLLHR